MLCFPFIIHNDTNVRAYCKFKLKGKGGDKGGDRITELLKAVKALPNEMERIVKQEVLQLSQLPDVLTALVQEIGRTRGQTNKEVFNFCITGVFNCASLVCLIFLNWCV